MNAVTHHLTRGGWQYRFRVAGPAVQVKLVSPHRGGETKSVKSLSLEQARAEYGRLTRQGWKKW